MKRIHTATAPALPEDPDRDPYYFASLDGEGWLGVTRIPTAEDYADLEALFDPRTLGRKRTFYMRLATRYLKRVFPSIVFHDVIEVADA